jgi:UDP-glucose 4-epimerase
MRIMITGASGYFGERLAHTLQENTPGVAEVVGVDVREPDDPDDDMSFLAGDTRKKRIEDLFKTQAPFDVVIHLARDSRSERTSDQSMMTNVYGAYHMLELALKYGVKKFIFPSGSIVYGAHHDNPALIHECHPLLGNREVATIRDRVEADIICQTFSHGLNIKVVILRIVPIWRKQGSGMLTSYMKGDLVPTLLGFDPMFQIIFEEEVLEAFRLAVINPHAFGAYNIPGRIFMPLTKIIRHLGKTPVPLPEVMVHRNGRFLWSKKMNFDFNYLKYSFSVDGTRARRELGYRPEELSLSRRES